MSDAPGACIKTSGDCENVREIRLGNCSATGQSYYHDEGGAYRDAISSEPS